MSSISLPSEKKTLLPVAALSPASESEEHVNNRIESALYYSCVAMLMIILGSIYYKDTLPPWNPIAFTSQLLQAGILPSLWASLPAPTLLIIFAPYFAEPSKVNMVRYWTYLLYVLGVILGAVIFGSSAKAMDCKMLAQ